MGGQSYSHLTYASEIHCHCFPFFLTMALKGEITNYRTCFFHFDPTTKKIVFP